MTIAEIRALTGMSKKDFAEKYHIPYRSIQNWELGERECPVYVMELLHRAVLDDIKTEQKK